MTTHGYELTKTPSGNTIVTCSEHGALGQYPDGEATSAVIQVHDRQHAIERNARPAALTNDEINAWLDAPEPGVWEPSAEERSGHVAIPLGHVIVADALAAVATHDCHERHLAAGGPPATPLDLTVRILDTHGRASDHDILGTTDKACLTKEIVTDARVARSWFVRRQEGAAVMD